MGRCAPLIAITCALAGAGVEAVGAAGLSIVYTADAEADRVQSLPGWNPPPDQSFSIFAGELPANGRAVDGSSHTVGDKRFFYVLLEPHPDAVPGADKRLTLWLNGGPGCSSMLGLFEENGPFYPSDADGTTLTPSPWSWNRLSSMLYLESPTGVGFSRSTKRGDYKSTDASTADDNYAAVVSFFRRFPHYRSSQFYAAGESYAGHYLPQLANRIVLGNQQPGNAAGASGGDYIPLAGFAAGNPYTAVPDDASTLTYYYDHGLVEEDAFAAVLSSCNGKTECYWYPGEDVGPCSPQCMAAINVASRLQEKVDIYNIYYDVCDREGRAARRDAEVGAADTRADSDHMETTAQMGEARLQDPRRDRERMLRRSRDAEPAGDDVDPASTSARRAVLRRLQAPNAEPVCVSDYTTAYLNRAEVKAALHVDASIVWKNCAPSSSVKAFGYRYDLERDSMVPLYASLLPPLPGVAPATTPANPPLRVLVYSGTADACVPFTGTQQWLEELAVPVQNEWRPWTLNADAHSGGAGNVGTRLGPDDPTAPVDGSGAGGASQLPKLQRLAGYVVEYQRNLTFATVKGAGHEVPQFKPAAAYAMMERWLAGARL